MPQGHAQVRARRRAEASDGAVGVPEAELAMLLHELGHHMHAMGSRFATSEALHPTDAQALSVLAIAGGRLTAGELARSLELSSGATTRLVDRLERVGHVRRYADTSDRRCRHIAISEQAAATAGAFFGRLAATIEQVAEGYGPDEQATIARFLREVITAVEQHELPSADG